MIKFSSKKTNSGVKKGNKISLDTIVSEFYNTCYAQIEWNILHNHGSREDVADIVQDVLEVVVHKKEYFANKPTRLIHSYILGIGWNLWLKELQKRKKTEQCLCEYGYWLKTENDIADMLALKKIEVFYKCLNRLNSEERKIILEEKSGSRNKQIAEKYGYRIDAFKKRKSACKKALMKAIAQDNEYSMIMNLFCLIH